MSDLLSPILVKELRQGLRARVFEGSFVMLQTFMVFAMIVALMAVVAKKSDVSTAFGEGFFWVIVGVPLLLIMPMRGCTAMRQEVDTRSIELIFLTRLTSRRIVAGKWAALVAQSALLVVAILPYAVLRYYLGNVNVAQDILILGTMLTTSAVFTALTVSVSSFQSKLARGMIYIFPVFLLMMSMSGLIGFAARASMSVTGPGGGPGRVGFVWGPTFLFLFYAGVGLIYFLEVGAARIAPAAENHVVLKRLLGVLIALSSPLIAWLGGDEEVIYIVNLLLLFPICLDAICTTWHLVPGLLVPFVKRGWLGAAASTLLMPGWPSGLAYSVVVLLIAMAPLPFTPLAGEELSIACLALLGTLIFPVAVILAVRPHTARFGAAYVVIQLILLTLTILFALLNSIFDLDMDLLFVLTPLATLFGTLIDESETIWLLPCGAIVGLCLLAITVRSEFVWRTMRAHWDAAVRLTRPPLPETTDAAAE